MRARTLVRPSAVRFLTLGLCLGSGVPFAATKAAEPVVWIRGPADPSGGPTQDRAPEGPATADLLEVALDTARWLERSAIATAQGLVWPADPLDPASVQENLYSGSAGVILFFLELHAATQDEHWLDLARRGADVFRATLDTERGAGLYTGAAGLLYTLAEVHRSTQEPEYREAALALLATLERTAKPVGAGVEWEAVTDVISGTAGTGLTLLWAAQHLDANSSLALAVRAGDRLLELGTPTEHGTNWAMSADFPRTMPNFSHGTAGVAYFLARLHAASAEPRFLAGARAGLAELDALAKREDGGYLVPHHFPDGEDLFYLGWCHGPAGTARLFRELWGQTGDASCRERIDAALESLHRAGIPAQRTPGFWDNVGLCCGSAGVAEAVSALARQLAQSGTLDEGGRARHEALVRALTDDLVARATRDETGTRWIQAEHRVRPELLVAQTGLAQGAAGIGLWLLHADGAAKGRPRRIVLPDDRE